MEFFVVVSVAEELGSHPSMEVMADRSIMTSRESSFNINLQPVPDSMQNVRLAYMADGTAISKPVVSSSPVLPQPPTYQGGDGGGGSSGAADAASASLTVDRLNMNMGEPVKRKRGRPRNYKPAGLALTSLSTRL